MSLAGEDVRHAKRKLDPLLPLTRIAAGTEASDNQKRIGLDEEKECVGKFLRARPPESLKDDGKLPGIVGHALHDTVDFGAKAVAQTGSLGLIPILRLKEFRARGLE